MLNTPSVMISAAAVPGLLAALDLLPAGRPGRVRVADDRRRRTGGEPSMMLAWFSSSEKITSSLPTSAGMVAEVGGEAGLEGDGRLDALEGRQPPLQLEVQRHRAGDGAHRRRADAVLVDGLLGRLDQARVVGQAQVVVGAEVEHAAGRRRQPGALRRGRACGCA